MTEHPQLRASEASETSFTERRRGMAQGTRPPPILKKSRGDSSNQKTARILTPTWKTEKQELQEDVATDDSAVVSPSTASEPDPSSTSPTPQLAIDETLYNDDGKPPPKISSGREPSPIPGTKPSEVSSSAKLKSKKSTFVANTASSKRRPQMSRRKSSNSSGPPPKAPAPAPVPRLSTPSGVPTRSLPPTSTDLPPTKAMPESAPLPPLAPKLDLTSYKLGQFERPPSRSPRPPTSRSSRSASPVLSRPPGEHLVQIARDDSVAGTQSWLVDADFKAKFANKLRQEAEAQKFSSMQSKVSTSLAARRSELGTKGKGKSVMILGADDEGEAEGDPRGSTSAIQSSDEEDEGEESVTAVPTALQKTKSQLTLLLETERRRERERERKGKNSKGRGR